MHHPTTQLGTKHCTGGHSSLFQVILYAHTKIIKNTCPSASRLKMALTTSRLHTHTVARASATLTAAGAEPAGAAALGAAAWRAPSTRCAAPRPSRAAPGASGGEPSRSAARRAKVALRPVRPGTGQKRSLRQQKMTTKDRYGSRFLGKLKVLRFTSGTAD